MKKILFGLLIIAMLVVYPLSVMADGVPSQLEVGFAGNNTYATIGFSTSSYLEVGFAASISNTPSSHDFLVVQPSSVYSTGINNFMLTNNSSFAVDVSISGGNMTGGTQWTLSDTATPSGNVFGLRAGTELTLLGNWTSGNSKIYEILAITYGDGYIFICCFNDVGESTSLVIKIDAETLAYSGNCTVSATQGSVNGLIYLDGYIYAGIDLGGYTAGEVKKINAGNMTIVSTWTNDTGNFDQWSLATDGTYLYAGYEQGISKIDPSAMTTIDSIAYPVGAVGPDPMGMVYLDGYLFSNNANWGIEDSYVSKVDVSTMTEVGNWTISGFSPVGAITEFGGYIYTANGAYEETNGKLYKLYAGNMTLAASYDDAAITNVEGLENDGTSLFGTCYTSPGKVFMARMSDLTTEDIWTSSMDELMCIVHHNGITYVGSDDAITAATVFKLAAYNTIVKKTPTYNYLTTSLPAGGNVTWGLEFLTPTNSPQFADGVQKSGNVTLSAEAS